MRTVATTKTWPPDPREGWQEPLRRDELQQRRHQGGPHISRTPRRRPPSQRYRPAGRPPSQRYRPAGRPPSQRPCQNDGRPTRRTTPRRPPGHQHSHHLPRSGQSASQVPPRRPGARRATLRRELARMARRKERPSNRPPTWGCLTESREKRQK